MRVWEGRIEDLLEAEQNLVNCAKEIQPYADVPVSNYPVGAALLTKEGVVYTAANVEFVVQTITLHAEILAIGKAINDGYRDFQMIAVYVNGKPFFPCGLCRQAIHEKAGDIVVIAAGSNGEARRTRSGYLFPYGFKLPHLDKRL